MDIYIVINNVVSNTENYKLNFVHLTIKTRRHNKNKKENICLAKKDKV